MCPSSFRGHPPLFFSVKCASQYILLRFLVFSCFTFCISETFLFFGNFCSIFPFIRFSVLLPSINNPKSINFVTLFSNNPLINYVYMCVISISYLNFSFPILIFFDIKNPYFYLNFHKLQKSSIKIVFTHYQKRLFLKKSHYQIQSKCKKFSFSYNSLIFN